MSSEKYESRITIRSEEPIDVNLLTKAGAKFGRVSYVSSERSWEWRTEDDE